MTVAYLGPPGTFSYEAALKVSSHDDLAACPTLESVVEAVTTGQSVKSVLPVENSTNGAVGAAWDALALFHTKLSITGQVNVHVRHQVYGRSLDGISTFFSHPQVWGQTTQWRKEKFPHATLIDCDSTASAVQLARRTPGSVAIAGPGCAASVDSDFRILVNDIADDSVNTTRFLVLEPSSQPAVSSLTVTQSLAEVGEALRDPGARLLVARTAKGAWKHTYIVEVGNEK